MTAAQAIRDPQLDQPDETLWDANDVAKFLKASRNWVYQQAEKGTIPSFKIGGLVRFNPQAIRSLGGLTSSPKRGQPVTFTGPQK